MTADVEPYELMKLRLLNAGHQALAYNGRLAGFVYAHDAAANPLFTAFLRAYWEQEARPTLPPVPGIDLDEYVEMLIVRFRNPAIRDTIARLGAFASDRIPKWVLPVVRDNLVAGRPVTRSAEIVASWARYAEGIDEHGQPIEIQDALRDELATRAQAQLQDPLAFIRDETLFGDLATNEQFVEAYTSALRSLLGDRPELPPRPDVNLHRV